MNDKIISLGFLDGLLEAIMRRFKKIDNALPQEEPAPYQQLVTGADGAVKWEERMAYQKEPFVVDILPETTVDFVPLTDTVLIASDVSILENVFVGNNYVVHYDDTEYVLKAYGGDGGLYGSGGFIGNDGFYYNQGNNNVPFAIMFAPDSLSCTIVMFGTNTESHNISIKCIGADVEMLPKECFYDLVLGCTYMPMYTDGDSADNFFIESGSVQNTYAKLRTGHSVKIAIHEHYSYDAITNEAWFEPIEVRCDRVENTIYCTFLFMAHIGKFYHYKITPDGVFVDDIYTWSLE